MYASKYSPKRACKDYEVHWTQSTGSEILICGQTMQVRSVQSTMIGRSRYYVSRFVEVHSVQSIVIGRSQYVDRL